MPTVSVPLGGLSSASPRTDKYCMAVFMGTDNIPHIHPETTLTTNALNNAGGAGGIGRRQISRVC